MDPNLRPAFIDFEASSLNLIESYPIEVGVCLPDGELHSWLVRPHPQWSDWSENAEGIHGISRQRLQAEGLQAADIAHELNTLLPAQIFCDAWTFDSFWLHRLFRAAGETPQFQLESISALLTPAQVQRWSPTRKQVIHELGLPVHRAANDALILHHTWHRLIASDEATIASR